MKLSVENKKEFYSERSRNVQTMMYKFEQLFKWSSGKPIVPTNGPIPIYGSNGIIGYTGEKKYHNKIILGRVGAYCGSVAYCPDDFNATDNTLITSCDEEKIDYCFAYYLLKQYKLNGFAGGSAQPLITQGLLNHLKCDIPALNIQKKIVEILSAYDNLIENNNKRIKILEQMAENLYKEWFVRFRFPGHETTPLENGIPKGWKIEKIKNCVKRLPFGKTYKEAELEKEGSVIVIDQSTEPFIGYHDDVAAHQASANNPIILFGDHSCKFVLMTRNFSLGENIVPFVSYNDEIVNPYYLFFATHKIIETTEYKRHWGEFVNKKILIPSIDLQKEFARMSIPLKLQLEQLLIENQNLIKQRDLLLPRLMSGKLAV